MDIILAFALILSHILADFYWQPDSWVEAKRTKKQKAWQFYAHALVAGILAYIAVSVSINNWSQVWIIPAVTIPHGLIDLWKLNAKQSPSNFVWDQLLHLANLAFVIQGLMNSLPENLEINPKQASLLMVVTSLLFLLKPTGIFVGEFTKQFQENLNPIDKRRSLPDAGRWIGYLERIFIIVAMLFGQWSVIGFLIAAKSILRVSDTRSVDNPMRMSEYIIIGSMMSFLIAIVVSLICKYSLELVF